MKKVFVSGCYDLLHSGHVEFFQQASQFGDLYVGIGSDATYLEYKHRKPMFPQEERLFMVKNIKAVKEAYINESSGVIDFIPPSISYNPTSSSSMPKAAAMPSASFARREAYNMSSSSAPPTRVCKPAAPAL